MEIRKAAKSDCRSIAELALMAGEGIPAYFWEQRKKPGQAIEDVGTLSAASETANFSYRNVHLAVIDNAVAGMLLAYRLPAAQDDDLAEYPEFIRPLIELEHCVPGSFYVNMLATYPGYRNQAVGTKLMGCAEKLAAEAGCTLISVEVFEKNEGALRLYRRLGYTVAEKRRVIPHPSHPYTGEIALMTKKVG
jgi:ribosomal protein S18 acetylase RimI-like enzyme